MEAVAALFLKAGLNIVIIPFVLLACFAALILTHMAGHFIAALACGKILRFHCVRELSILDITIKFPFVYYDMPQGLTAEQKYLISRAGFLCEFLSVVATLLIIPVPTSAGHWFSIVYLLCFVIHGLIYFKFAENEPELSDFQYPHPDMLDDEDKDDEN